MEVSHFLRELESEFLESLYKIDELEVEELRKAGCSHCGGNLDRSDYWRKPRGVDLRERKHERRFSLCCRD